MLKIDFLERLAYQASIFPEFLPVFVVLIRRVSPGSSPSQRDCRAFDVEDEIEKPRVKFLAFAFYKNIYIFLYNLHLEIDLSSLECGVRFRNNLLIYSVVGESSNVTNSSLSLSRSFFLFLLGVIEFYYDVAARRSCVK